MSPSVIILITNLIISLSIPPCSIPMPGDMMATVLIKPLILSVVLWHRPLSLSSPLISQSGYWMKWYNQMLYSLSWIVACCSFHLQSPHSQYNNSHLVCKHIVLDAIQLDRNPHTVATSSSWSLTMTLCSFCNISLLLPFVIASWLFHMVGILAVTWPSLFLHFHFLFPLCWSFICLFVGHCIIQSPCHFILGHPLAVTVVGSFCRP